MGSGSNSVGARRFLPTDVGSVTAREAGAADAGAEAAPAGGAAAAAALALVRSRWRDEILALRRSICERWRFCDLRTW